MIDVQNYLKYEGDLNEAARQLAAVFREGVTDTYTLPEIETEKGKVTHELLGCTWHHTMSVFVDAVAHMPPDTPTQVVHNVQAVIDQRFYMLARMCLRRGGPIGPSNRCE